MQEFLLLLLYLVVISAGYFIVLSTVRHFFMYGKKQSAKFTAAESKPLVELFGGHTPEASLGDYLKDPEEKLPTFRSEPILGQACYLVLVDRVSPVNQPLADQKAWTQAKEAGSIMNRLEHYNEVWERYQDHEKAAVWIFLIGGVYTVGLRVLPPTPVVDFAKANGFLGDWDQQPSEQLVQFPSGELLVAAPADLGKPEVPIFARIPPGRYRVGIFSNYEMEAQHQNLKDVKDYKDLGCSDWELLLQRFD